MAAPSSCLVMLASPGYLLSSFFELNNTNNSFQGLSRHQLFVILEKSYRNSSSLLEGGRQTHTPETHSSLYPLWGARSLPAATPEPQLSCLERCQLWWSKPVSLHFLCCSFRHQTRYETPWGGGYGTPPHLPSGSTRLP